MDRNSIFRRFRSSRDTVRTGQSSQKPAASTKLVICQPQVSKGFPICPWNGLSVNPEHPQSDISVTDKSSVTLHQQVIPRRSDREGTIKKIPGIQKGNRGSEIGDYLLSHLRSTIGVTKLNFSVRNGKRWNLRAIVTWISHVQAMLTKTWSIYQPPW